jgi:hypothetical protein
MRIVIPQNLDRQDRKRLRQLIAELSKMSGAETFEEWQAFKKYHCREPHRADVVEQEITALMRGDVKRAHAIRTRRERSAQALRTFWAEQNLPRMRRTPAYHSWFVLALLWVMLFAALIGELGLHAGVWASAYSNAWAIVAGHFALQVNQTLRAIP